MNKTQWSAIKQISRFTASFPREFKGMTYRELLEDADNMGGCVVYWGCWTIEELDQRI